MCVCKQDFALNNLQGFIRHKTSLICSVIKTNVFLVRLNDVMEISAAFNHKEKDQMIPVSLFNNKTTFMDYLMPKPPL